MPDAKIKSQGHGHYIMYKFTNKAEEAHFFIQTKGKSSGKPLKTEIPNCIGIRVNDQCLVPDYFFYVIQYLYITGAFAQRLRGSVIPYIRHCDITEAIVNFNYERSQL